LLLLSAFAVGPAQAREGWPTVEKVVGIFATWQGKKPNSAISSAASEYIDYSEMAERALGRQWNKIDAGEKREFVNLFTRVIEERYYPRWHKVFSRGKLEYVKDAPLPDGVRVTTLCTVGKKKDTIVWQLSKRSGTYKVVSLAVDDKDLVTRIGSRLQKHMAGESFDKLIAWMKDEFELKDKSSRRMAKSTAARMNQTGQLLK
jgi:Toluene tolerance, Ttg2.